MRPSEFFIGPRGFFGALVPGSVWVVAALLLLSERSLPVVLEAAQNAGVIQVLSFLTAGFVAGLMFRNLSFFLAIRMAMRLRKLKVLVWETAERNRSYANALRNRTKKVVELTRPEIKRVITVDQEFILDKEVPRSAQDHRSILERFTSVFDGFNKQKRAQIRAEREVEFHKRQQEALLFEFCKAEIAERSERFSRLLEEKEGEIILVAGLLLPLVALDLALLLRSAEIPLLPVRFDAPTWCGILIVSGIGLFTLMLYTLLDMHESVRRGCFEMYLLLNDAASDNALTHSE